MNNLTANQIILLFQFYTGQEIQIPSATYLDDLEILLKRGLVYFPEFKSFQISSYGRQFCERIINETTKP